MAKTKSLKPTTAALEKMKRAALASWVTAGFSEVEASAEHHHVEGDDYVRVAVSGKTFAGGPVNYSTLLMLNESQTVASRVQSIRERVTATGAQHAAATQP